METESLGITRTTQPSGDGFVAELTCKFRFTDADPKEVFKVLDRAEALIKEGVENHGI